MGFEFRTTDNQGNSNSGHTGKGHTQTRDPDGIWRDFTTDERWALVEFLKTLH